MSFLENGGGQIISGILGGGMGLISGAINAKTQKQMQQASFEYGREMAAKQNQYELERMALQNDYNRNAANYSQQLAKEMWEYTGYGNQKRQMEEAGLNPALMYGGGGGGGQTASGGSMSGPSSIQPMALQVGLQAQQQMAQTELIKAQTNKIKAETLKQTTTDMAQGAIDLVSSMIHSNAEKAGTEKTKAETAEAQQRIENLKANNQQIQEGIAKIKNENKLAEFQIWVNNLKKEAGEILDNGAKVSWADLFKMKELQQLKTEIKGLETEYGKADFENHKLVTFFNNLDEICKGEIDGFKLNTKKYEEMDWNLKNDKAFGDILESLGTDSKFSKLLMAIIRYFANKK